jgi:ribonuclease HII
MSSLEKWLQKSIPELKERFLDRERAVPDGLLEALAADPRHSAQELARKIRERRHKNRAEGQRLRNLLRFEVELWAQGHVHIAGVDEAGMAPLAGPVVAAAVILPKGYKLKGLDDSKKILDEKKREALARTIKQDALCWATGRAEVEEIDTLNIYHAGLLAMRRAFEALSLRPDFVLVDARKIPECTVPQRGIIHGDALSLTIAAASVIAKTTRDAFMVEMDKQYPGYGFADHKGYPTPVHCELLKKLGAVPIHRRSFGRVREVLGLDPLQGELFASAEAAAAEVAAAEAAAVRPDELPELPKPPEQP